MNKLTQNKSLITLKILTTQLDKLTIQERKVLALAIQDLTCKEIAEQLSISPATVIKHRKNICRKLDIKGKEAFRKTLRLIERLYQATNYLKNTPNLPLK